MATAMSSASTTRAFVSLRGQLPAPLELTAVQVYYVRLTIANMATSITRDNLLSLGTCLGKLTKTGKFRLHITARMSPPLPLVPMSGATPGQHSNQKLCTAVPILAEHARYKIWVKENGAQPFLYGSNGTSSSLLSESTPVDKFYAVAKAHVGRWSDDCPEHSGCVVLSMADIPLGFGVTARSTAEARRLDPTGIVCFRQSDCGEYLRDEDTLFAG